MYYIAEVPNKKKKNMVTQEKFGLVISSNLKLYRNNKYSLKKC